MKGIILYMYICTHVYMYKGTYVHMDICTHIYIHVYMCIDAVNHRSASPSEIKYNFLSDQLELFFAQTNGCVRVPIFNKIQ